MPGRARLWSAAVLASLLAHGVLLGVLALAVDPAPTAPQDTAPTRLAISTQTVESQTAAPAAPAAERPDEAPPDSARMGGAAVPLSRARPAALAAQGAQVIASSGPVLAPRAAPGAVAAAVGAPAGEALSPVDREAAAGVPAAPAPLAPGRAGSTRPVQQALQPAAAPAPGRARPVDPSPPLAQALPRAGGATQTAVVAPVAMSAPASSVQGAPVDAAVAAGSRVVSAPSPGRRAVPVAVPDNPPVSVVVPDNAPLSELVAGGARIAAVSATRQGAAQPLQMPQGTEARAATAVPDAGAAVLLAAPTRRAPPAPRLSELAAPADAAPLVAVASPAADAAQVPGERDPSSLAAPAGQPKPVAAHVTAALAWSGAEGDGAIDPVSLAAIQSFLRPGDGGYGESPVRDGISTILAAVPCARLQTVFDPRSGQLELRGHIPEDGLRAPVLAALRAHVGASIPVADNMLVLPRPTCGALSGIAAVGLAQSREQARDPRVVGPTAHARVYSFVDGDRLSFDLTGPDYPAYFYIDYFDADGMVLHLQPNEIVPLGRIGAKERIVVGAGAQGQPALDIRVAPPFGQEIMVAFATSVSLYDGLRPVREPAGPYLEFLRTRVAQARATHPDFRGEWVYFFISTRAR